MIDHAITPLIALGLFAKEGDDTPHAPTWAHKPLFACPPCMCSA